MRFFGRSLPRRWHMGLASKVLLPALAVSLVMSAVLYLFFADKVAQQAIEDLRNRLENFATVQAAELEGPLWEFDQRTVDRLVRSYALNPDLQWLRLYDAKGQLLAKAETAEAQDPGRIFHTERLLTHHAGKEVYAVGRLEVTYHDGRIRQGIAARQWVELPAAVTLLVLLALVLAWAVHWQIGRPLRHLRDSLKRNAATGLREPLPWKNKDELGQVAQAYNDLLAEISGHTERLEQTNAVLEAENAQRRQAEQRLMLVKTAVEATDAAMVITDRDFAVLEVNAAGLRITGYKVQEVVGRCVWATFLSVGDIDKQEAIRNELDLHAAWSGECWGRHRAGKAMPIRVSFNALRLDDGAVTHHVIVFSDISQLKATEELLKELAYTDSLTGLPNRALFMDRLEREIAIDTRRGRGFALLFIDLDNFKTINDSLSHSIGDRVLAYLGKRMRNCLRDEDTLARMGGDEFTVIVRETTDVAAVKVLADALLACVAEPMDCETGQLEGSASIGVALFPQDGGDADTLMKNADTAMYLAKGSGGGQVRFFEPSFAEKAKAQLELRNQLKRAIREEEFIVHFQPIVDIASGVTNHCEVLVRWLRDGEVVPPDAFIPFAEETGLVTGIGRMVLEMAFAQERAWIDAGNPIPLSVNLSRSQFQDADFVDDLIERAERHGVDPGLVVLEITESMIIADPDEARLIIGKLILNGFRIAVDDFGIGYSSLSVLVEYQVHIVKLDKSLIRNLEHDPRARSMISGFIELFQRLGLEVVAEGVETALQHEFLVVAGCNMAQGWLYGRPMPAEGVPKATKLLESRLTTALRQSAQAVHLKQ